MSRYYGIVREHEIGGSAVMDDFILFHRIGTFFKTSNYPPKSYMIQMALAN